MLLTQIKIRMKILYAIQGTGNGHLSRALEIIPILQQYGEVDILISGNQSQVTLPFDVHYRFHGLSFVASKSGGISYFKSLLNIKLVRLINEIRKLKVERYNLVISDFEPISAWSAKLSGVKSISICNQMSIIIDNSDWNISKMFMKYFAKCDHLIGFDYKSSSNIFQPICDISLDNVKSDDFYLVYLPYIDSNHLVSTLSGSNFKIYTNDDIIGNDNIEIKRINKDEFTYDLVTCKGVITHSGFSTTSEALILNKKLWSIPIVGQYEQEVNADKLSKMGVYTSRLSKMNLSYWLSESNSIRYKWNDPIDDIIKKIIYICKSTIFMIYHYTPLNK